jgi:hypothetical protein
MSIIYTYPIISGNINDNLLVSDSNNGNKTSQVSISRIKDLIDVVDSFNTLRGNVTISGGTNISLVTSSNDIKINSSAVSGSGTTGTIPMWTNPTDTLIDSPYSFPDVVGESGQVLALPTPIGTAPYELVWVDNAGSASAFAADGADPDAAAASPTADSA